MNPFRCELFQTVVDIVVYVRFRALTRYLLMLGFLYSAGAMADTVQFAQCERDGIIRLVELTERSPTGLPCQVMYHKPQENQPSLRLWSARSEVNYCRVQFDAFLITLETKYYWVCSPDELSQNGQKLADQISNEVADETPTANETPTKEIAIAAQEPVLAAAIPDSKPDKSISNSRNVVAENSLIDRSQPGGDYVFDIEEVKTYIPSGIYFYDSAGSKAQTREDCPADGHFLWNTRDRSRPVFEMGLVLEFPGATEATVVQRDGNGKIHLSTQSMTLQPLRQTTTAAVGATGNDGIELEIRGTSTDSGQAAMCRYLRG